MPKALKSIGLAGPRASRTVGVRWTVSRQQRQPVVERDSNKAKLKAAQDSVRAALVELLEGYDPLDEDGFRYAVGQVLNIVGQAELIAALVGVSPATVHRWAAGTSCPMPLTRGATAALLKEIVVEGIEAVAANRSQFLQQSSRAGHSKIKQAYRQAARKSN